MDVLPFIHVLLTAAYDSVTHSSSPSIPRTFTPLLQLPLQICHSLGRTILWERKVILTVWIFDDKQFLILRGSDCPPQLLVLITLQPHLSPAGRERPSTYRYYPGCNVCLYPER